MRSMGTLIEWYRMDLIQSVGAELCAAAKAAVTELCRLTEEQDWECLRCLKTGPAWQAAVMSLNAAGND